MGKKQCVLLGSGRKEMTFLERRVSLPHRNAEIMKEVIMGILSAASDIPLVQ